MIKGIVNNTTNIMAVAKDFAGLIMRPGQVFTGIVLAKEGTLNWLLIGDSLLQVRSEKTLRIGEKLKLRVLGFKGEDLLVEKLPLPIAEDGNKDGVLEKAIEKYGLRGEKETVAIKDAVLKLPVEENTAVRYLLDPFLFAALLIPKNKREDGYNKLEIVRYKGTMIKEDVWEVSFQLQMPVLKNIEIKLKLQYGNLYVQIWTDSAETENILQKKKEDIESFCTKVEIIPCAEGPLIIDYYKENIDFMV